MSEYLVGQVLKKINEVYPLYYRLILIVGSAGSGKTKILQEVAEDTSSPVINVNLELSRRMLDLTKRQRALYLDKLLNEIIGDAKGEVILLDNIEILFDYELKQNPLHLLQKLSRNKTIVATWNGTIVDHNLTYAVPNHREYRRYPIDDLIIVATKKEGGANQWKHLN